LAWLGVNSYWIRTPSSLLQRGDEALKKLLIVATDVFLPVVAIGELYYGAYKSGRVDANRQNVTAYIVNRFILDVDANTADVFGQVKQGLRAKGRPIPENDIWIAAIAIQYDLTLITDDAHFAEVDNLRSQRW
jgi:tRNA(fMet)-specific endonuclease VapC